MKKKLVVKICSLALMAVMALSLGACGKKGNEEAAASTDGKTTLNVWHQWSTDTKELRERYEEAVQTYMDDNPDVIINTERLDTEAYKTKISAEFAGDAKGIDVFYYWGAGMAKKLVNADKLLALDDYLTDDVKAKLVDGSTSAFSYNAKLYSLPSFSWYMTLYCNKDLFDQAGVAVPTNYEELVTAVEKLAAVDGVTPFASGAKDGWNAAFIYQALALREVGAEDINKMLAGNGEFTGDGYKAAAEKVVELYQKGAFGKNPLEQSNDDANAAFGSGRAAMRLMGSWFANSIYTDETFTIKPENVVALKIPMTAQAGNESDYCGGFVESFWVNKNTANQEEAAKFAIYINEKMGLAAYETGSGFTGWKSEADESGLNPLFVAIKGLLEEGQSGVLAWDTSLEAEPAAIHNEQVQTLFAENADVESFIEEHEMAINK